MDMKKRVSDVRLSPDKMYLSENSQELAESTLIRGWVQGWLDYISWYNITAMSPDVTLSAFFDAPVVQTDWRIR